MFERNYAALAAHDRKVENQQEENDRIKNNPEPDVHGRDLARTPTFAARPGLPQFESLQLIVEVSFLNEALNLFAVEFSHAGDYIGSKRD
ncbi:MAG: hypothetical protein ACXV8M_04830 [Candidatus Angelobacter sp.]